MASMLVAVKISKGFKVWTDMAKSLEKEAKADALDEQAKDKKD